MTAAASANDDSSGAATTTATKKAARRGSVSIRVGASLSRYSRPAAITASRQFVTNSESTSDRGKSVCNWMMRWIGRTASRMTGQRRGGVSSSAAVRIALGGQRTDVVAGGSLS